MKKILILLAACVAMTACKKDDKDKVQLDPSSKITLNGINATSPSASTKAQFEPPYTIQTVAEYAWDMALTYPDPQHPNSSRGFITRDIEAGKLTVGMASEVVAPDDAGGYKLGWFVQGVSDVLCRAGVNADGSLDWVRVSEIAEGSSVKGLDTIAYVPNAVIRKAEADIKAAFDAGDYERCMVLFETAYTFIPIANGAEWLKLKADGVE